MNAQALNTFSALKLARALDRPVGVASLPRSREPGEAVPPARAERNRSDLIAEIKQKVKAGYYGSRDVVEDLSDTFAKAFNQI